MSSEPPNFGPKSPFGPGPPAPAPAPAPAPKRVPEVAGAYAPLENAAAAIGGLATEKPTREIATHAVDKWWKRRPVQLAIVFGVAALPSVYWLITSTAFRATAFGGFVGLWLALSSIWLVVVRFGLDRERPRDMTLPALAAGCGALALVFGGAMSTGLAVVPGATSFALPSGEPWQPAIESAATNPQDCFIFPCTAEQHCQRMRRAER